MGTIETTLTVLAIIFVAIILTMGYVKAPPDHVYIISGGGKQPRYLIGKSGIRIPYLQRVDRLSLKMLSVSCSVHSLPTTPNHRKHRRHW